MNSKIEVGDLVQVIKSKRNEIIGKLFIVKEVDDLYSVLKIDVSPYIPQPHWQTMFENVLLIKKRGEFNSNVYDISCV